MIKAEKTILDLQKNKDMLLSVRKIVMLPLFQSPKKEINYGYRIDEEPTCFGYLRTA